MLVPGTMHMTPFSGQGVPFEAQGTADQHQRQNQQPNPKEHPNPVQNG
jgi:hypothetical protein